MAADRRQEEGITMSMIFFIDWITDYYETPKMQLTRDQEILGMLGIAIAAVLILGTVCLIAAVLYKAKKKIDSALEKKWEDEANKNGGEKNAEKTD